MRVINKACTYSDTNIINDKKNNIYTHSSKHKIYHGVYTAVFGRSVFPLCAVQELLCGKIEHDYMPLTINYP